MLSVGQINLEWLWRTSTGVRVQYCAGYINSSSIKALPAQMLAENRDKFDTRRIGILLVPFLRANNWYSAHFLVDSFALDNGIKKMHKRRVLN